MDRFRLAPLGPYSLTESARFAGGFGPTSHSVRRDGERLRLAFVPDGADAAVGVEIHQSGESVECVATRPGVGDQAARILSLDVDGSGFASVGGRDRVVGELQRRWPGFRPVSFPSPFEAGAWFLLSQRARFRQALAVKQRLAERLGEEVDGLHAFPAPRALAELEPVEGLPETRRSRLEVLARAALDGKLDGARLREMGAERALLELRSLVGIGPFTSEGILVRGANEPDWLPLHEPRLRKAVARAYGEHTEPKALSERWRPYRSWVAVMLRRTLD